MKKYRMILLPLIFTSCASKNPNALTSEGRSVNIIKTRMAPKSCEALGKVEGINDMGVIDISRNIARNQAGDLGANSLLIKDEVINGKNASVLGIAYNCQ